ncbi:type 2 lanthipeptide synthetase LanM [Rothia aerolata]|uniref:type 2 lanthipeptide synthetase LanM n=1 Tax=Rothia aerolata TaxID=1812262 RepID=UPI00166D572E|nr:type 2 lanthipeptide synthetase LanM [Rothia aerolata]
MSERLIYLDYKNSQDISTCRYDKWRDSVVASGDVNILNNRLKHYGNISDVKKVLCLNSADLNQAVDNPEWVEVIDNLYFAPNSPLDEGDVYGLTSATIAKSDVASDYGWLFFAAPILNFEKRLLRKSLIADLASNDEDIEILESLLDQVWLGTIHRSLELVSRVLILELNVSRVRGELAGNTPEERFQDFLSKLKSKSYKRELIREYPVLARRLYEVIISSCNSHEEFIKRLWNDREKLRDFLGTDPIKNISSIDVGAGDTHNGGRAVHVIKLDDGKRLVYKPRNSTVDYVFQRFCEMLEGLLKAKNCPIFNLPKFIHMGNYGWFEFIDFETCSTVEEVHNFYIRQGVLLSVLYALGGSDFHFENIIASGEFPVPVDLEALFHQQPDVKIPDFVSDGDFLVRHLINDSVLQVGLLPVPMWGSQSTPGVDFSGLGGKPGQIIPGTREVVVDLGGDKTRFESTSEATLQKQRNRPSLNDAEVDASLYLESFKSGFTTGYQVFIENRTPILQELKAFTDCELRYIVRHTATYAKVLATSYHPDLLRDYLDYELHLNSLWAATREDKFLENVVLSEVDALSNGDIPFFKYKPTEKNLYDSTGIVCADYFKYCPITFIENRIKNLNDKNLLQQQWIINAALNNVDNIAAATPKNNEHQYNSLIHSPTSSVLDIIDIYAQYLYNSSVGEKDKSWLTTLPGSGSQWTIAPTSSSLYNGKAGIALFFHSAAELLNSNKYKVFAESIAQVSVESLCKYLQGNELFYQPVFNRPGAHDGISGILYTAVETGTLQKAEAIHIFHKYLNKKIDEPEFQYDVIAGYAGILNVINSWFLDDPAIEKSIVEVTELASQRLIRALENKWPFEVDDIIYGFGHGVSGLLSVIEGSTKLRGDVEILDNIQGRYYRTLDEEFDLELKNISWCRGSAGVLAAYTRSCYMRDKDTAARLSEHVRKLTTHINASLPSFSSDSFCHGLSGLLSIYHHLRKISDSEIYSEVHSKLFNSLIKNHKEKTINCGLPSNIYTPGLFDGFTGTIYPLMETVSEKPLSAPLLLLGAENIKGSW